MVIDMLIRILLLAILIFINGVLSASEIAYLSLDKYAISRKRDRKAKKILKTLDDESKFLSTIQIGITLAGFLASAFASETFTDILIEDYGIYFVSVNFTENVLMIVITLILSYITLVFGELVPKKIGRSNPLKVAYLTIDLISLIAKLFYPLIILLTCSTELICKILHIKEHDDSLTEKDIKRMIITGSKEGIVEEKEYILNIFEFNDKKASKIMTPRGEITCLDINDTKEEIIKKIKNHHYTRYPILKDNEVVGYINIKDFIYLHQNKNLKIKDILHNALFFDKNEKIDDIFRMMQENHETFSLTMEDAIEEILGNIEDEYN